MQPKNPTGNQPVTPRSIAHVSIVFPLEESKTTATAPASSAPPPSPLLAIGQPPNRFENITQTLLQAGYTSAPASVGGRYCIRVIASREAVKHAA